MKEIKTGFRLLFLCVIMLILTNCSKDTFESETSPDAQASVRFLNKSDLAANLKAMERLGQLGNSSFANGTMNRSIYDSVNDFYINTDKIVSYEKENLSTLTFSIFRKDIKSYEENLVLVKMVTGDYVAYLMKYALNEQDKKDYKDGYPIQDLGRKTEIIDMQMMSCGVLTVQCDYSVSTYESPILVSEYNGDVPDRDGTETITTYTLIGCSYTYTGCPDNPWHGGGGGGGGNSGGGNGGNGGNGGGIGGGGSGGSGGGPVPPQPPPPVVIPVILNVGYERFMKSLIPEHQEWADWLEENPEVNQEVDAFFDNENSMTYPEKVSFVREALESLVNGGKVDFPKRIIFDNSFLSNPCLTGIFAQLGGVQGFQNYLSNFDGNFSVANLKFTTSTTMDPQVNATTSEPNHYLITITFNANNLDRPALDIARTFIHEMIHAEMFRKLLSVAGKPNIPWTKNFIISLKDNYPGLYDYYMRFIFDIPIGQQITSAQHEAMAQHYRNMIKNALSQFDNNANPQSLYDALAWTGLQGTTAWDGLSQVDQNNVINTVSTYNQNTADCQ